MREEPDEWVVLMTCGGQAEAQVVRATLEAAGIPVVLSDESSNTMMAFLGTDTEIRVSVPADRASEARELLAGDDAEPETEPETEDEPPEERKLHLGAVLGLGIMFMTLGFVQFYLGRPKLGLVMVATAATTLAYLFFVRVEPGALALLFAIYAADLISGVIGVLEHNRAVEARRAYRAQLDQARRR